MKLFFREYGRYTEDGPSLILLHGLLGSSSNWHSLARALAVDYHLIVPDLRNHGRSNHSDTMDYPAMADDIAELMDEHGLDSALLIGHSMGGKAAMWYALEQPAQVAALVVVDIAPVPYGHGFGDIFQALQAVNLDGINGRAEAESTLAVYLDDRELRQYLLQNLVRNGDSWAWRINLDGLIKEMDAVVDFPLASTAQVYPGPTLFAYGTESDYVQAGHQQTIRTLFPYARMRAISGAGHWVYSDQPVAFMAALKAFLAAIAN